MLIIDYAPHMFRQRICLGPPNKSCVSPQHVHIKADFITTYCIMDMQHAGLFHTMCPWCLVYFLRCIETTRRDRDLVVCIYASEHSRIGESVAQAVSLMYDARGD